MSRTKMILKVNVIVRQLPLLRSTNHQPPTTLTQLEAPIGSNKPKCKGPGTPGTEAQQQPPQTNTEEQRNLFVNSTPKECIGTAEFSCLHPPPTAERTLTNNYSISAKVVVITMALHDNSSTNNSGLSLKPPDREKDFYDEAYSNLGHGRSRSRINTKYYSVFILGVAFVSYTNIHQQYVKKIKTKSNRPRSSMPTPPLVSKDV
jgi:ribosomal protein L20A (L18A)